MQSKYDIRDLLYHFLINFELTLCPEIDVFD